MSAGQDQGVQPTSQRSTGANVATTQGTLAGSTLAWGGSVRAGDRNRGNERNGVEDRNPWSEREAVQDRNRGAGSRGVPISGGFLCRWRAKLPPHSPKFRWLPHLQFTVWNAEGAGKRHKLRKI